MTNKEYRQARQAAETANELYTFEHCAGGFYYTRYMSSDDIKELRANYKDAKKAGAFALDGFKGRAVIINNGNEVILWSYAGGAANWSYSELSEIQSFFEANGKRYGLIKEFTENGII